MCVVGSVRVNSVVVRQCWSHFVSRKADLNFLKGPATSGRTRSLGGASQQQAQRGARVPRKGAASGRVDGSGRGREFPLADPLQQPGARLRTDRIETLLRR